ncbi:MAG: biotin/lipoyl-containing protein, partial [Bacteroidia bacterium]
MAEKPILMPKMGESIAEATIIRWLKNVGERIEKDEPIVEIATDKVDSEIPSTEAGILTQQMHGEGAVVKVGEPVAMVDSEGSAAVASASASAPVQAPVSEPVAAPVAPAVEKAAAMVEEQMTQVQTQMSSADGSRFYSPLVMNIARTEGISMTELESIPGTGKEGRVTKSDIMAYLQGGRKAAATAVAAAPALTPAPAASPSVVEPAAAPVAKPAAKVAVSLNPGDEVVEMDRVRKLIADHMVMSKHTSPHVTSFVEA